MGDGATPTPVTAAFAPGAQVSGYLLEEQIGRGGMAVVFRALDVRLNRQVALKIMAPGHALDGSFRQRFVMESQAAAAVDDPHIIPVYQAGEADGVLFIAMRLVRGGDLKTLVARRGPLSPARAERIISDVASALDAAHAHGLVHRDVKPANMLLAARPGRPDHVYLSDFGVSKAALEPNTLTGVGQFLGTVDYAAPEQIQGKAVDGRTDQYALGCAAYELLCGRPPFGGRELLAAMFAQVSEPAAVPSSLCTGLPEAVDEVFAKVLAKSPADRYETCQDFARALRSALGVQHYQVDSEADGRADALIAVPGAASGNDITLDPAIARAQPITGGAAVGMAHRGASLTLERPSRGDTLPGADPGDGAGPWGVDRTRSFPSARKVLVAVLAVVIAVAGVAAGVLLRGHSATPLHPSSFSERYPGGLAVTGVWKLTGPRGSGLDVTITASNHSSKTVTAQLEEPIPLAVARSLTAVSFAKPGPSRTLLARGRSGSSPPNPRHDVQDLAVLVWVLNLRAGGRAVVGYRVREDATGATEARLLGWVDAFKRVAGQQDLEPVITGRPIQYLVITPAAIVLQVGNSYRLTLSGVTSHAKSAPSSELAKAVWQSDHRLVATVRDGVIRAVAAGQTLVTARIGAVTASAIVIVESPGGQPVPVYSFSNTPPPTSPPVTPSTSASASVSPSPSGSTSPSPSSSASGSPTSSPSPSNAGSPSPAAS